MIPALEHKHALVVDDDTLIREFVANIIESEGVEVSEASNGQIALNSIISHKIANDMFDFLITDIQMPEINGIELIKVLKNRGISLPTIIMTGNYDRDIIDQLKDLKYVHFLKKPFWIGELLNEVLLIVGDKDNKKSLIGISNFNQWRYM